MERILMARRFAFASAAALPAIGILLAIADAACSSTTSSGAQPEAGASSGSGSGSGGGADGGVTACNSMTTSGPDAAASSGGSTVALFWQVVPTRAFGIGPGPDGGPDADTGNGCTMGIPGVEICVVGHAEIPCVMSGSDGTFTLPGLPPGTDLAITLKKDGYVPSVKPIETARTDMQTNQPIFLVSTSDPQPDLGFPVDSQQKGGIAFFVIGPAPPDSGAPFGADMGATVTLSPVSGKGPFYGDNNYVDAATMSVVGGTGVYYNVDPGDYTLTVNDTKHNCAPISFPFGGWGYPVPPASVKFPVMAGYWTDQVGFLCTAKSAIVSTDGGGD